MLRHNTLFLSLVLLSCGALLINNGIEFHIVNFINNFFNLHLDIEFRCYGLFYCGILLIILSLIAVLFFLLQKGIIRQRQFYILSSSAVIIFYFFFLLKDAVNVPITDDFRVLKFLAQYANCHSFSGQLQLLLQPMRISAMREVPKLYLITLIKIFGAINFKWLIWINGLVLLAVCGLLFNFFSYSSTEKNAFASWQKELLLLAFLFILLQFQSFDTAFWTISGIASYWTILFTLLAIQAAGGNSRSGFALSVLFSLLASFTQGNGLVAFPVCAVLFYLQGHKKQALGMLLSLLITYILYMLTSPYPTDMAKWEFNLFGILIFAAGFLGSSMQFMYVMYLPVATGFICLGVFIYATVKKYYLRNRFIYATLLFVIMTAFVTAPMRLSSGPLMSRYGIYSSAAVVLCIIVCVEIFWKKNIENPNFKVQVSRLILLCAIGYNFLSGFMFYPEVPIRKVKLQNFVSDWKNGRPITYKGPVIIDGACNYLDAAVKTGVWHDE